MENYLNITQLAKLRNITTETLRHYDRIGLLKPEHVDPDTGYRYYALSQVEEFDTIIDLKKLGLPLADIKQFMDNRSLEYSSKLIEQRTKVLEKELEEKQRLLLSLQQKKNYIELAKNKELNIEKQWSIKSMPSQKMVVSKAEQNSVIDFIYEFTKLRKNLVDDFNVFGTNISGSVIDPDSFSDRKTKRFLRYPALPLGLCTEEIKYGEVIELQERECLICYGRGLLSAGDENSDKILRYIEKNGYEICGYIYENDVVDISMTSNADEVVFRLEIPVRKIKAKN